MSSPRVSIGLPVYNGENYLSLAIDSILSQTWQDLELVVSDNASTDRTAEICRDFAAGDARIRYVRNELNLGAAPNYNRTFDLARGEYFKWAAHDDVLAPRYLERCLAALEGEPDAVLCQSLIESIDENGDHLAIYDSDLRGCDAPRASTRFAAMVLRPHPCHEFFGLIRRSALLGSLLHGDYHGADRSFLAQMALRGRLLRVPEPLLRMREHESRYSRTRLRAGDRLAWHDARKRRGPHLPTWRTYAEYWKLVRSEPIATAERLRCFGHLVEWWPRNWNWVRMAVDVLALVAPEAPAVAERIKHRLIAPAPGRFVR